MANWEHFEVVKHNGFVFRNVNVNSQFLIWKNFTIYNESKLSLINSDFYKSPGQYMTFLYVNYLKRKKRVLTGEVCWVLDNWSINYYHWIVEGLTKVLSINVALKDVVVLLPEDYRGTSFHEETIKMLGAKVQYFDNSERVRCELLYVPVRVAPVGTSNPVYLQRLKERLISFSQPSGVAAERVYISRKSAGKRKIVNEEGLAVMLRRYGFQVVSFDGLSVEKQIALMRNARVLVSLHGAALTNMIFMPEHAQVIELSRRGDDNLCYRYLAQSMNLQYRSFECVNLSEDIHESDFSVDTEGFEMFLKGVLG